LSNQELIKIYSEVVKTNNLANLLSDKNHQLQLSKLVGSSLSFYLSEEFKNTNKPFLLIFSSKEEAAYYLNDFEALLNPQQVLFYPGSYRRPYQIEETDNANILLRSEVLNRIQGDVNPYLLVTYPDALFEKVLTKKQLKNNTVKLSVGDLVSLDFMNETLHEYNFSKVDFVAEPGDFSVRGGIIDVFSYANTEPYRIEFFGDEVDSIRTFDIEDQLSKERVNSIDILPNIEHKITEEHRQSFIEYLSKETIVFIKDRTSLTARLDQLFEKAINTFQKSNTLLSRSKPSELFCKGDEIEEELHQLSVVELNAFSDKKKQIQTIEFNTKPQNSFNKKFDLLITELQENNLKGIRNFICCDSQKQIDRFEEIFQAEIENETNNIKKIDYQAILMPLYQGFTDLDYKVACYTDHQIFERYHKFRLKNGYAKKQAISLKELTNLVVGDFVTHIDHGIGKFGGLQKIDVEGKHQEAIKLYYGERDILFISIHSLHKISKYSGKEGTIPKVHKLGSGAWKKVKQKTSSRIRHIAYNLIELYAKRKVKKGFSFDPDSYLQHELEASFLYEDTPDQFTATQDIKKDMESSQPMDRLVCGDVGFGKTEVAIRAAFKAVDNGKQVAVLVPTTVLAFQHFKTFGKRLKDLPVEVAYLNRFKTTKERKQVIEDLKEGKIDIVIGTHQLTNAAVKFKDLGLLIVDEEQKFGVSVKDKLKTFKENVDTLTLTATPIPRTLQFSLMAARDLSIINTPPPNRVPIESQVIRFSEEVIRDAIRYEIQRGGQVFFIHNRIENIKEVAGAIQRLLPDAKIKIGHGQMEGKELESLMLDFIDNEFDVLVSTTIVESGLDVPNANTIFINNANNFGLSDLHQMRGRVGRSNKKAFCYFITPPQEAMSSDARRRIEAISMFTELGSGIQIAMKDLEIRGAGDLLGGEQTGFINEIGFDTYQKILNETVQELKENEFKDLYGAPEEKDKTYAKEVQIDTDFEILFPDNYINITSERMVLYNRLATIENEEALASFQSEIEDRFGKIPTQVVDLLNSVRIKWHAKQLGLERLILKKGKLIGYFIANQQSSFYESKTFTDLLSFVQRTKNCIVKEKQTKDGLRLLLTINSIDSINRAEALLSKIKGDDKTKE
jgi:transcription-repair coupling factor (superfamily II helicase)